MTHAANERRRLLVVDDDATIRVLLQTALGGKYDVTCVPNGADIPKLIEDGDPDLIILDINEPGSEGFALCAAAWDRASIQRRPILFMTVSHGKSAFLDSLTTGGNSRIGKPFDMPALKNRIEGMLKTPPSQ